MSFEFPLEKLLEPVHVSDFINDYMEEQPLFIRRNNSEYYSALFGGSDLNSILAKLDILAGNDVYVDHPQRAVPEMEYAQIHQMDNMRIKQGVRVDCLLKLLDEGAKVSITNIDNVVEGFGVLLEDLTAEFQSRKQINLVLYKGELKRVPTYAVNDSYYLQLFGSSEYRLYSPKSLLPMSKNHISNEDCRTHGEAQSIAAGDIAYVPRGFGCQVSAANELSVSLEIQVFNTTWAKFVQNLISHISESEAVLREGCIKSTFRTAAENHEVWQNVLQTLKENICESELRKFKQTFRQNVKENNSVLEILSKSEYRP